MQLFVPIAFDPQGDCFNLAPPSKRISITDADFVEIAHCTVGQPAIFTTVVGNVTFIINGGLLQPECGFERNCN